MSDYADEYRRKLTTAEDAIGRFLKSGDVVIHGVTIAEPPALLGAIAARARAGEVRGVKIYSFNPQKHAAATYMQSDLYDAIEPYSWFLSKADRARAATGLDQFIPSYLHQVPKFIREYMVVDLAVTTVSPMDKAGFFTFGTANDLTSTAARVAKKVVVEVNENMPRVFGDSLLHVSDVDAVVENHVPLMELPSPPPRSEDPAIGKAMADLIQDGAVLQLGIGGLPNAITPFLATRKDMGIHTELFGPGMVDLIRKGVINGRRKTLHRGKHVFAVSYGTRDTFEFMNDNPSLESYPSSYVMDPTVIARNDNMVAINSIIEVDLTGQCNAEEIGGWEYSGTGGQLDFVRAAYAANNGISIMAFYSTAKHGEVSRVVPRLHEGAAVTTPRMDTHYLATEYGIVNLKNKSVGQRALAIVSIAHPRFRDDLLREAEKMRLL